MTTETTTPAPAAPAPPPAVGGAAPPPAAPAASAITTAAGGEKPAAKPVEGAKPPEMKPGEKPAEGAKPKEGEATKPAEFKVPKGFESVTEALQSTVKELGLEGEKAQKFADSVATIDAARSKALDTAAEKQEAKWLEEAKADPDIGGAKWDGSMKEANKALAKFGGPLVKVGEQQLPQLAVLLHRAGLGNNVHVLKALALVGRALKDDSIAGTEKPAPKSAERKSDAQALYGPQNDKKPTNPAE